MSERVVGTWISAGRTTAVIRQPVEDVRRMVDGARGGRAWLECEGRVFVWGPAIEALTPFEFEKPDSA